MSSALDEKLDAMADECLANIMSMPGWYDTIRAALAAAVALQRAADAQVCRERGGEAAATGYGAGAVAECCAAAIEAGAK